MTFKLNDKVRVVHSPYGPPELAEGQVGIVVGMDELYIDVRMDNGYSADGIDVWPFTESEIELIWEEE